ncbi:carotenoid 1,2-hydratase [Halovulum dunhuangense]|uniref:Carotenoid 1,2-hydratase n=1 Tax=Halovulum dunhuangense TaxID=1505036 RepID=A0A849KZ81_9RHOB|nr:carotenoid 1,2-hydratase [Halovulum dunhuangense]
MIGFIGSVFSPWYAWAGRKNPLDHSCINVALYGPGGRWTMTERGASAVRQTADMFQVGPSRIHWEDGVLVVDIDEMSTPHMNRIRGQVRLTPDAITPAEVRLDAQGAHLWRPFAPGASISVDIERPGWRWEGHGYFDANFGTRALEADFSYWTWARMPVSDGTVAFYDAKRRDGGTLQVALHFGRDGSVTPIEAPPLTRMARSRWTVRREMRADPGYQPRQVAPMLDAPFYTRSVVRSRINGEDVTGVHEALDLDRFASPFLKPMLAVRVPRRARFPV